LKRVLIVGPNIGLGGVERASCNLANALCSEQFDVRYLGLIPEPKFYSLNNKIRYIEPGNFNKKKLNFIKTLRYIRKEVFQYDPTVIIVFTKFYAALTNLALWMSSYKIILTERSSPLYKWPLKIEFLCRFSFGFKSPSKVISQTNIAASYHRKYYTKSKVKVIPNALRPIQQYPDLSRKNWILAVGRFHDDCKGFDRLIRAFNIIQNKTWRLVFAGGTQAEGQYLLKLTKDKTTASRIDFLGKVKDIDKIYAQSGVFVMPSRSEGFPNALCEAMSAGCACISFDFIAGPKDIIKNSFDGVLVENGNINELAQEIDNLILDEEKRLELGYNARLISKRLSYERVASQYIDYIFD